LLLFLAFFPASASAVGGAGANIIFWLGKSRGKSEQALRVVENAWLFDGSK
jgi:hypothetical protein